jgi:hypothetical protein
MSSFLNQLSDQLNIQWAWEKVRKASIPGDIWINEIELSNFELDLEDNLQNIADEFRKGTYKPSPIKPLPFPKNPDKNGTPQVRQCFCITVRDQVAWTAIVNTVGPLVDSQMPPWSYGNRLYRSIWIEDENDKKRRKVGNYRHSSGQYYLPFRQSWPIYKRHAYLSILAMSKQKLNTSDDQHDLDELEIQKNIEEQYKCPFLMENYWQSTRPKGNIDKLYWCSIDLAKFYPSINISIVIKNIVQCLPEDWKDPANRLLTSMVKFPLYKNDWSEPELQALSVQPVKTYSNIPTGLYVAGFLANAALLELDKTVSNELIKYPVSHLRYVDDHIFISFDFETLLNWVNKYAGLLRESKVRLKINYDKIEPAEFSDLLKAQRKKRKNDNNKLKEKAERKCKLDPKFPSPLMTKTLALVSDIAKTDFNLLEPNELNSAAEQLEHLLLVDIPEEEIPSKTRLSFAAGRLTKIAECRLAAPPDIIGIQPEINKLNIELNKDGITELERAKLLSEYKAKNALINKERDKLKAEIKRAFSLLRKVLRERPDRTRLWARAIYMCRLTGVNGLKDILEDISMLKGDVSASQLTYEALLANFLVLISDHLIKSARTMCDDETPDWKKEAAKSFIDNVLSLNLSEPDIKRWYLQLSWKKYCLSLLCCSLILKESQTDVIFNKKTLDLAKSLLKLSDTETPYAWVWWAARMSISDLHIHIEPYIKDLVKFIPKNIASYKFWSFFPLDIPDNLLKAIYSYGADKNKFIEGWLFDSIRNRDDKLIPNNIDKRIINLKSVKRDGYISLYSWCNFLPKLSTHNHSDPRLGEWTALEIIRQIISEIDTLPFFGPNYCDSDIKSLSGLPSIHPANYLIPSAWLSDKYDRENLTWDTWKRLVSESKNKIFQLPENERIKDIRYTPLYPDKSLLFREIDTVRGIGLILYGLLKCSFDLPAIWNGFGHTTLLSILPKILLNEMTCSSWTLGILQGCLSSRASENKFIHLLSKPIAKDNDMAKDPLIFKNCKDILKAIVIAQATLEDNQMATFQYNARQLVPISLKQLTMDFAWQNEIDKYEEPEGV